MKGDLVPIGPVSGVAVDAGKVLGDALKSARGEDTSRKDLFNFKRAVVSELGDIASTVLVCSRHAYNLFEHYPDECCPMIAYEDDAYLMAGKDAITPRPRKMHVSDYHRTQVDMLKYFMYYAPSGNKKLNTRKRKVIAEIGRHCAELGLVFVLEPLVYHPKIKAGTPEFAKAKPDLVARATEAFAAPKLHATWLKVEFPVDLDYVEGYGEPVMTRDEALAAFRRGAEAAQGKDILYLSAGVPFKRFVESLELAKEAGVNFRGFMCGRAIWSDGIGEFGKSGYDGLAAWLRTTGRERLVRLNGIIGKK